MANTKSAAKQARAGARRNQRNKAVMTAVKSILKQVRTLATNGKKAEAQKLFPRLQSSLDKAAKKGVIHRNAAARYKTRLNALLVGKK
jgi:small subunit ribosomal protein S20